MKRIRFAIPEINGRGMTLATIMMMNTANDCFA